MGFLPVPSQTQIITTLRTFLVEVLPSGVDVIAGQDNRVPEPQDVDFVVMTTIRRERIETNVDTHNDCAFMASISGTVMTVTSSIIGLISTLNVIFGTNVTLGTTVQSQTSGAPGGPGIYAVFPSQNVASEKMACGTQNDLQPTRITIQLDVHGPNSADNAQTISTLFRDDFATLFFFKSGFDVRPLYADDPKQVPFLNAEQQYETRYVVEAVMQANQVIAPPQDYADQLQINLEEVL